ncbi:MAG: xanthine dehydrogenase family protein subunit M [Bryobacteraceae bacterium]|nr:xanthine dehydrogenase family protein subunit M [Bryobacteraceae bacterium]
MIPNPFSYAAPESLQEALELLAGDGARVIAGGMSLVPLMKLRLAAPELLVDLRKVRELNFIREDEGSIRIGAMATHFDLESSALLHARCPLLAETASHIGDVQVRNIGTLGGSLAHADPAADYPAALAALDARVRLVGKSSERTLAFEDFLLDTFATALEPGEILAEVIVPAQGKGVKSNYQKMAHPASGFAVVGAAAVVERSNGNAGMVRLGITGLASKGFRARNVEAMLEGQELSEPAIRKAAAAVADGVEANSDLHASAEYRKQMAAVYARRALLAALEQSR